MTGGDSPAADAGALGRAAESSGSKETVAATALRCPACRKPLTGEATALTCLGCDAIYATVDGQPDLRLPAPRPAQLTVQIGGPPPDVPPIELDPNPRPEIELSGLDLPPTISHRFATWLPRASRPDAVALDLGCGDTRARPLLEKAGYRYVGIDYTAPEASYLADAHALPFAAETFDLVATTAVIEYLRHPYVAMQEVHHVLRPGGVFAGNVGFLVPYLPVTYFHHTHMGILSTLTHAGFTVDRLLLDRRWTALEATTQMSYFSRMPPAALALIVRPQRGLHRLWWGLGSRFGPRRLPESERYLRVTADVEFIAVKS